ncbi:hypothetical protein P4S72_18330 [Vibrio sp. PP-XX7]
MFRYLMSRYLMSRYLIVSIALLLSACTTSQISHTVYLEPQAKVALLPIVNHSQTPLAGASAANILTSLWYQKHLPQLVVYPYQAQSDLSFATDATGESGAMAQPTNGGLCVTR